MLFKILPDVQLRWSDVWRSAFITAIVVRHRAVRDLAVPDATAPGSTYGAAGSLVLVLMWVYYSSLIIFFGTALTRVAIERAATESCRSPRPSASTWRSWKTTAAGCGRWGRWTDSRPATSGEYQRRECARSQV
jgi:uncharacterized BrkB/YihY/UPF0761 family membrane protein